MDMHVPEPGQHAHPLGRNDFGPFRNLEGPDGAHRFDAFPFDQDYAVLNRRGAETVYQGSANQGLDPVGLGGSRQGQQAQD